MEVEQGKGANVMEGRGAKVFGSKEMKQGSVSTTIKFLFYHKE
jgi:hypothetical protein